MHDNSSATGPHRLAAGPSGDGAPRLPLRRPARCAMASRSSPPAVVPWWPEQSRHAYLEGWCRRQQRTFPSLFTLRIPPAPPDRPARQRLAAPGWQRDPHHLRPPRRFLRWLRGPGRSAARNDNRLAAAVRRLSRLRLCNRAVSRRAPTPWPAHAVRRPHTRPRRCHPHRARGAWHPGSAHAAAVPATARRPRPQPASTDACCAGSPGRYRRPGRKAWRRATTDCGQRTLRQRRKLRPRCLGPSDVSAGQDSVLTVVRIGSHSQAYGRRLIPDPASARAGPVLAVARPALFGAPSRLPQLKFKPQAGAWPRTGKRRPAPSVPPAAGRVGGANGACENVAAFEAPPPPPCGPRPRACAPRPVRWPPARPRCHARVRCQAPAGRGDHRKIRCGGGAFRGRALHDEAM
jgi:hypothetical protein